MMTSSSASLQARASDPMYGWVSLLRRLLIGAVFFLLMSPEAVFAQETDKNIGILIVDLQRIQRESAAAVSVQKQTEAMRKEYESTAAERARSISQEEAELADLRERLTGDEFRQRVQAFEKRVFENRDFVQQESARIQTFRTQASIRLRQRLAPILAQILREQNAQLMLDKSQVVLSADALEVTDEVLIRLNKALPAIDLTPQEGEQ